ncbi:MAG: hypothetical protein AAGK78_10720 [Planctomycetota bacterium]
MLLHIFACSSTWATVRVDDGADLLELKNIRSQFAKCNYVAPIDPIRFSLFQVRREVERIGVVIEQWLTEHRQ